MHARGLVLQVFTCNHTLLSKIVIVRVGVGEAIDALINNHTINTRYSVLQHRN